jgi:hypothetical protein
MSTNAQLTIPTDALPVTINSLSGRPITREACLGFIEERVKTQLNMNFAMIAAGVLYLYTATVTNKSEKRAKMEGKAALAKAFGETTAPNSHVSRSKRYEFAKLCFDISIQRECRPLVSEAAKQNSLDAGLKYLTREFMERAISVAALARYFGTERTSGGHRREHEPVRRPFLLSLRTLVDQAEKQGQQIPFIASVKVLAPAAAQRDVFELLIQLIPHTTDDTLPALIDLIERRRARAHSHRS